MWVAVGRSAAWVDPSHHTRGVLQRPARQLIVASVVLVSAESSDRGQRDRAPGP